MLKNLVCLTGISPSRLRSWENSSVKSRIGARALSRHKTH